MIKNDLILKHIKNKSDKKYILNDILSLIKTNIIYKNMNIDTFEPIIRNNYKNIIDLIKLLKNYNEYINNEEVYYITIKKCK